MPQASPSADVPQFPVRQLRRLLIAKHSALQTVQGGSIGGGVMAQSLKLLLIALALLTMRGLSAAQEKYREPVEVVAPNAVSLQREGRQGLLPIYANRGLDTPNPDIDRAVIVIHGRLRNAGTYFQSALAAL